MAHCNLPLTRIVVFISLLFMAGLLQAQDIIYKKDNSTVKAKVLEVNAGSVVYKLFDYPDGSVITISKDEISVIIYQNGTHEVFNQLSAIPDSIRIKPVRTRIFKNLVFAELGGNGGIYSLNYERRFKLTDQWSMTARIGYSAIPAGSGSNGATFSHYRDFQTIPLSASLLHGKINMLELGIGYTPLIITESHLLYDFRNYVAPSVGYRYQNWSRHFIFRTGFVIGIEADRYPIHLVIPEPYISWGFSF